MCKPNVAKGKESAWTRYLPTGSHNYAVTSSFVSSIGSLRRHCCCKPTAHCNKSRVPCTMVLFYINLLLVFGFLHHPSDLDEPEKPATSVFFQFRNIEKVISLVKMELSAPRPIFCVHKGSIVHRFSIEPLCRR